MIRPSEMLAMLSDDTTLAKVATEVEQTMNRIIEETVSA